MEDGCKKKKILCVVGPTACYKSLVGVQLAKRLRGEIVSADSVQVYVGMDVGSAKPTKEEQAGISHHMLDCIPIDTPSFSVAQYRDMAVAAIDGIFARGNLPIVVGGSGLYVNALTSSLNFAVPSDAAIRAKWAASYAASPEAVYASLLACDPETARRLHPNDGKRIVRALEVFEVGGKPLSDYGNRFHNTDDENCPYDAVLIGLNMERERLYERIDMRVGSMLQRGLLQEATRIYHAGYSRGLPAMQSIGYKQLFAYLDGDCTLEEAVMRIKQDTRNFAKRQLTWFRRDKRITWFDLTQHDENSLQDILRYAQERL